MGLEQACDYLWLETQGRKLLFSYLLPLLPELDADPSEEGPAAIAAAHAKVEVDETASIADGAGLSAVQRRGWLHGKNSLC